jgi:hypothetical protein
LLLELRKEEFELFVRVARSKELGVSLRTLVIERIAGAFRKYPVPFFAAIPDNKYEVPG